MVLAIMWGGWNNFFAPFNWIPPLKWLLADIIALILILLLHWSSKKRFHFIPLAFLMMLLIYPGFGNRPIYNPAIEAGEKASARKFLSGHNDARFAADWDALFPDTNLIWNLNDFRYYNPTYLRNYVNIFARADGLKTDDDIMRNFMDHAIFQPDRDKLTDPLWGKLGLGYWVGGPPGSRDLLPDLMVKADWRTENRGMIGREKFLINGLRTQALFAHAPSLARLKIEIPLENPALMVIPAFKIQALEKSDGVLFEVRVNSGGEARTVFLKFIEPGPSKEMILDLSMWAGKTVELIFITNPGPRGDKTMDWSGWGRPSLLTDRKGDWVRVGKNLYMQRAKMGWIDKEKNGKMVFSQAYYPGWRAYSEGGQEIKIGATDGVFQSVDSQYKKARFVYKPVSFAIGLWSFLVSGCFMIAVILLKNKGK